MKAYIATTPIGVFGLSEKNKILVYIPFPKDPKEAAKKYKEAEIRIIEEEKQAQTKLWSKGYKEFVYPSNKQGVKHVEKSPVFDYVRNNLEKLAIEKAGFKPEEFRNFYLKFNIELTKVKIKVTTKRDALIIQAQRALEDVNKTLNTFSERLREWYGIHFPELNKAVDSHEKFAKLISQFGSRKNFAETEFSKLAEESIGIDIEEADEKILKEFSSELVALFKLKEKLSKYIEKELKKLAPNLTAIAGPLLAAKLLSKAGGLEKLAKMPSSTIQLLGAEKALFRYLHGKGKPPKHGIIFSHPYVQKAKKSQRGKVARVLASKLSAAARIDYFSGEDRSAELKKDLEERLKDVLLQK